jgi:ADP-ribose pyrophosphatase YjhB (NUDIX family)
MASGSQGAGSPSGRRFARLAEDADAASGSWPVPPDGLCLSAFLLLSPQGAPHKILVGHLNPQAPWGEIGALDGRRIDQNAGGWMLPSCHLMYYEPPGDAADRVLKEQLGLGSIPFERMQVFSESYPPRRHPGRETHWDLEFLYWGDVPASWEPAHPAWRELRFVDPSQTPRREFTRSHDDVLELAGFHVSP